MTKEQLKEGRLKAKLTQLEAARRLDVSQPYLSQLEKGQRPVTAALARAAAVLYRLPATTLPVSEMAPTTPVHPSKLARQLSGLGYPGFAHLRAAARANPAEVVLQALLHKDLEVRLSEALPWLVMKHADLDWPWLLQHSKLHDAQNRLGFVVAVARQVATRKGEPEEVSEKLSAVEDHLEHARLAKEDTLCRESMPDAERRWLRTNRSPLAQHWNLLTSLSAEQLS